MENVPYEDGFGYYIITHLSKAAIGGSAHTTPEMWIEFAYDALNSKSVGDIGSVLGHELIHVNRLASGMEYPEKGSQEAAMVDVEAYTWELQNATKFDLTKEEIKNIMVLREEYFELLTDENKVDAAKGDYSLLD